MDAISTDFAKTASEVLWARLSQQKPYRVLYADFQAKQPVMVWTLESADWNHGDRETRPDDRSPGLVWVKRGASSVSCCNGGISVTDWDRGSTGWFPLGNVFLADAIQ
jgi:hypothetical protein